MFEVTGADEGALPCTAASAVGYQRAGFAARVLRRAVSFALLAAVGCQRAPSYEPAPPLDASTAVAPTAGEQAGSLAAAETRQASAGAAAQSEEQSNPTVPAVGNVAGSPARMSSAGAAAGVPVAGSGSESGPRSAGGAGAAGLAPNAQTWPADCERRFVFKAHGRSAAADSSKYALLPGAEHVESFYFSAPWNHDMQLLQSREHIDNRKIVHHWMLYALDTAAPDDGEIRSNTEQLIATSVGGGQFVLGGVPGATDLTLPDGIGLRLPSGKTPMFSLEVHYFNAGAQVEEDASAIEICVTSKKRPVEAAAHWLGTLQFNLPPRATTEVNTTCRPTGMTGPVHIMSISPHMHRTGAHSTAVLARASGERVTLLDTPYVFQEQRLYRMPLDGSAPDVVLNPGDTLTTTCRFENTTDLPISYGESTRDEMCFLTAWAWPAGNLHNDSKLGMTLGVPDDQTCLDP